MLPRYALAIWIVALITIGAHVLGSLTMTIAGIWTVKLLN